MIRNTIRNLVLWLLSFPLLGVILISPWMLRPYMRLLCALGAFVVVFCATFASFNLLVLASVGDPARSGRYSYAFDILTIISAGLCAIFAFRLAYWRSPHTSTMRAIIKLAIAAVTLGSGGLLVIEVFPSVADSSTAVFGAFLYYRAFRTAFPGGNKVLYAMLIFLEPSILYWPSLQGKEAPMMVLIGLFALGLAKVLRQSNNKGYILMVLGIIGVTLIRPHFGAMLIMAASGAFMLRPFKLTPTSLVTRLVMVVMVLGMSMVVVLKAKEFVGLESLSVDAVVATLSSTLEDATEAGSSYQPPSLTDPLGLPKQIITVFYRPWPWEAHRMVAFVLSMEGMTLLGLTLYQHKAVRKGLFSIRKNPYVIFIVLYTLAFMVAFMAISNFSILGRQRLMLMPFFFMLLCHPKVAQVVEQAIPRRRKRELEREPEPQPALATQPY